MTSSFEFDPINQVVCWRLAGDITEALFAESLALVKNILSDTQPKKGVIDLSAVTSFQVSAETIKRLAFSEPIFASELPRVVVAPSDHLYGLARMFASLTEHLRTEVHVVRTLDEAYELLGIRSPEFRPLGIKRETGT